MNPKHDDQGDTAIVRGDGAPDPKGSDATFERLYRSSRRLVSTVTLLSVAVFVAWAVLTEYTADAMAARWGPVTSGIVVYLVALVVSVGLCRIYSVARQRLEAAALLGRADNE